MRRPCRRRPGLGTPGLDQRHCGPAAARRRSSEAFSVRGNSPSASRFLSELFSPCTRRQQTSSGTVASQVRARGHGAASPVARQRATRRRTAPCARTLTFAPASRWECAQVGPDRRATRPAVAHSLEALAMPEHDVDVVADSQHLRTALDAMRRQQVVGVHHHDRVHVVQLCYAPVPRSTDPGVLDPHHPDPRHVPSRRPPLSRRSSHHPPRRSRWDDESASAGSRWPPPRSARSCELRSPRRLAVSGLDVGAPPSGASPATPRDQRRRRRRSRSPRETASGPAAPRASGSARLPSWLAGASRCRSPSRSARRTRRRLRTSRGAPARCSGCSRVPAPPAKLD